MIYIVKELSMQKERKKMEVSRVKVEQQHCYERNTEKYKIQKFYPTVTHVTQNLSKKKQRHYEN